MFYLKVNNVVLRYDTIEALSIARYIATFPGSVIKIPDGWKVWNHRTGINTFIRELSNGYTYNLSPCNDGASLYRLCVVVSKGG